jgi:hypothetical protein
MESDTIIGGSFCDPGRRDFTALEAFVRDVVVFRFRWMFEVELEDGSRMDIYEHRDTLRYLYVAEDGRAFEWVRGGRFREIDPWEALMDACQWWYHRLPPAPAATPEG